jgi:hypothetical protein
MAVVPKEENLTSNVPPGWSGGDPTENVKALAAADSRRNDDLRHESERFLEARLNALYREVEIRNDCAKELSNAESRRIDEQAKLRAEYATQLRDAEAKRIDAIRAVDVGAVGVASERAAAAATALASQVSTSAETLRGVVAAAAASATATLQQAVSPILTRLTTLEQAANQAAGKQSYADPAFVELLGEVKQLREANRQGAGKSDGISASWLVVLGAASLISIGFGVVNMIRTQQPVVYQQPSSITNQPAH